MWIPGLDPVESPDPLVTCFDGGHGTHVTGIYLFFRISVFEINC